jgi:hypothetical protein
MGTKMPPQRATATRTLILVAGLLLASMNGTAFAKDSLSVTVTNATQSPAIVNNGQAVGTIQLFYHVAADEFPMGFFATFDVDWTIGTGSRATNYGTGVTFDLIQDQQGGNVDLQAFPNTFTLTHLGQTGTSTISVFIAPDKDGNWPSNADGTTLVGNLKLDAGSSVGSVTNIQVHIVLAKPSHCLKVYNFVTDQDFNLGILSTTNINVHTSGSKKGLVKTSQPGQFSDNVLIANVCATDHSFNLGIDLDSSFSTSPAGNPGNAVMTYTAAGEFDTSDFGALMSTTGIANRQSLCLLNVTVGAGESFLATVHSKVKDDLSQSDLPADRTFDFSAALYDAANAGCTEAPEALASPNPATFTLPFTVNGN